ncbi:MAG: DUF1501 domain-containing protein [Gemmataceae bacterium]|nr:DUF1501 domain-containing protein [Gemmataceae bacterium]
MLAIAMFHQLSNLTNRPILTRRDFLRLGAVGGLSLPLLLQAGKVGSASGLPHGGASQFGRARRCLLLFLTGGPPQHDTFDPKPHAPTEIRGELSPIATRIAGVHFSELFPRLARQADKLCVLRSVTHPDTVHTSAGYTMLTGVAHPLANTSTAANIRPTANDHPHLGSLLARFRPPADGAPPFIALPEVIKDAAVNEFPGLSGGFLGKRFDPILIEGTAERDGFRLPEITLPADVSGARLHERRSLLERYDRAVRQGETLAAHGEWGEHCERAFALIRSTAVRQALDLEREPTPVREAYGRHLFGLGCLLGRRLLEAGVPLVSVYWHYEGPDDSPVWDTHWNNFIHLRNRLAPPTDQAVAMVLADLSARGLLDDTLVICMGEFGRTPRINRERGRDHWPHAQTILLAGAGIRAGSVYGASDRIGAYPAHSPVTPPDLFATLLHLLGIPLDLEVHDRTGQPRMACTGSPIRGLLSG